MHTIESIDAARRHIDVSQKELCRTAGIAQSTYVRTKKKLTSPTERTLTCLANALSVISLTRKARS